MFVSETLFHWHAGDDRLLFDEHSAILFVLADETA